MTFYRVNINPFYSIKLVEVTTKIPLLFKLTLGLKTGGNKCDQVEHKRSILTDTIKFLLHAANFENRYQITFLGDY